MIFFIICILLFFFCIKALRKQSLNAQKMKKELLPRGKPIQQKEPPQPKEKPITTTVKISRYDYDDIETMVAEGEEVSALNLGGYVSESGGYINYSIYKVRGTNKATNRKNTRPYTAKDKDAAIKLAEADGLLPPFETTVVPYQKDESKDAYFIQQINSCGYVPPADAVTDDLRDILNRIRYSDDVVSEKVVNGVFVERVRPIPGPSEEFAMYADSIGIKFSKFISRGDLLRCVANEAQGKEKTAFFEYCILCHSNGCAIGNWKNSEFAERISKFAETAEADTSLLKSIYGRDYSDYLKPHHGSKAYKAVAEYFGL